MARNFIAAPILLMLAVVAASAQGNVDELRKRLEPRFEIVPIANGVVLTPRFKTPIRAIELSDAAIAIDGTPVTGAELRDRLGSADAEMLLSFLPRCSGQANRSQSQDRHRRSPSNRRLRLIPTLTRSPSHPSRAAP